MSEFIVGTLINLSAVLVVVIGYFYTKNKDRKDSIKQSESRLVTIETGQNSLTTALATIQIDVEKLKGTESRLVKIEEKHLSLQKEIDEVARLAKTLQKTLDEFSKSVTEMTVELRLLQGLPLALTNFTEVVQGIHRIVAEHGMSIQFLEKTIQNHIDED